MMRYVAGGLLALLAFLAVGAAGAQEAGEAVVEAGLELDTPETIGAGLAVLVALANFLSIFVSSNSTLGKLLDMFALSFGKNRSDPNAQ